MSKSKVFEERRQGLNKGNVALGFYILALVLVPYTFFSSSWLIRDGRIKGSKLESFGLWNLCLPSFTDPKDSAELIMYGNCSCIYDSFAENKDYIPFYIFAAQVSYAVTFVLTLGSAIGSSMFLLCRPSSKKYRAHLTCLLVAILFQCGASSIYTVLSFAQFANYFEIIPGHDHYYFGWTFFTAIVSCIAFLISGHFYFMESFKLLNEKQKSETI